MFKELATSAAETLGPAIDNPSVFARFERFTAGFCMAIPFYLIVIDGISSNPNRWLLALPLIITFLPLMIPLLVRAVDDKNIGLWITLGGTAFLLMLYFFFVEEQTNVKGSISAYVRMVNPHIFGMLLSIAAMLFVASGVVYWEKKNEFKEGGWRSFINLIQGLLLLGVVVIPFDTMKTFHMVVAVSFFLSCGFSTVARETKPENRMQQRFVDFIPVIIMGGAMLIHFIQEWGWLSGFPWNKINLLGAESIALWVIGIDFILVSLKREIDPNQAEKKEGRRKKITLYSPDTEIEG
jgi:hypothetical protein